ncbi:pilus assembly protein N-terminal domain-containing protein [Pyxidicoccus xibeiensis]|uniref:pilus assembly protein N-terminal domain-containing protein n=1 Tax=Pyxidicoccus xibeiensis TaxID=2906759 RepID=UPI0020A6E07C|nr:pilus assembly protein N-terminal domain-containing protein [Pyxidicoccus xibeiensis]MCP3139027.1 pilus assembly protein N-terminal domain-containing protein [Pyxidicoccus xibeiensis]
MPARMYSVGAFLAFLVPAVAGAWPVDLSVSLEPGKERFHKLATVDWVEVEDAAVATAELLPGTNEVLLTGHSTGRTHLLLYAEGRFAVWRLTVGTPPPEDVPARLAAARKACPDLKATEGEERSLSATVKNAGCRAALLELLRTDAYVARELELTFDVPVLQEQLASVGAGLQPLGLEARYSGAGVVLTGSATPEVHRRALWELFRRSVGRVPLEDRVEVKAPESPPDAGTADAGTAVKPEPVIPVEVLPQQPKRKGKR